MKPSLGAEEGRDSPRARVYFAEMSSSKFLELAQLCPDLNEVGVHLLSVAKSLAASQHPTSGSEYKYNITYCTTV